MTQTLDKLDAIIFSTRLAAWNARRGPRIGDKIRMGDGSIRRLASDSGSEMQTTSGTQPGDQAFYLGHGYCSFSGSLGDVIAKDQLYDTGRSEDGSVWFFHHDQVKAVNAVDATIPCRVYALIKGR